MFVCFHDYVLHICVRAVLQGRAGIRRVYSRCNARGSRPVFVQTLRDPHCPAAMSEAFHATDDDTERDCSMAVAVMGWPLLARSGDGQGQLKQILEQFTAAKSPYPELLKDVFRVCCATDSLAVILEYVAASEDSTHPCAPRYPACCMPA